MIEIEKRSLFERTIGKVIETGALCLVRLSEMRLLFVAMRVVGDPDMMMIWALAGAMTVGEEGATMTAKKSSFATKIETMIPGPDTVVEVTTTTL
jgi:hypothetical protein